MLRILTGFLLLVASLTLCEIDMPGFGTATAFAADDENCLMCHRYRRNGRITPEGERKYYYVEESEFMQTVHFNVRCRDCHYFIDQIPHAEVVEGVDCARRCHIKNPATGKYFSHKSIDDVYQKSSHGRPKLPKGANAENEKLKPYCIFCHINPKYMSDEKKHEPEVAQRCNVCHENEKWVNHWYTHTARRINKVQKTPEQVVELCSSCHADEKMLRKYMKNKYAAMPDKVLKEDELERFVGAAKTYDASFHASFIKLGWEKPAHCLSCHADPDNYYMSVHDIRGREDPQSAIHIDNRAKACSKCHEGTDKNFSKITEVHSDPARSSLAEFIIYEFFFWLVAGVFFMMTARITLVHNRKIWDRLLKKGHYAEHNDH